jgi:hypothetical protein
VGKNRLLVLSVGTAVIAVATVLWIVRRDSTLSSVPITIRYLGTNYFRRETLSDKARHPSPYNPGEAAHEVDSGLPLWITNHTGKILDLSISQVEVRVGTVWTNYPLPGFMPSLRMPQGKYMWSTMLNPHAAAPAAVNFAFPETVAWRMKLSVSENLVGVSYLCSGIKGFFSALLRDHILRNPFPKGIHYVGQPREVVSEEFYGEPADHAE